MVKCKSCGAVLKMDDAFCSYCGTPNEYFKKHREDMAEYEQEFRKTKDDVYHKTNKFANTSVYVVIICVLVALNVLTFFITTQAWDISYELQKSNILSNMAEHEAALAQYEREENFIGLREYYYANNLYYGDELQEYRVVIRFSEQYASFYENLMKNQIGQMNESSYNYSVEFMADNVSEMAKMISEDDYYIEEAYAPVHMQSMEFMYGRTKDMLRAYASLTEEQLESLDTASKAKIMMMIEEGVPYEADEADD